MKELESFKKLNTLFSSNGFSLYFVGGAVRDYLLFNAFFDLDLVTNATPDEMKNFIQDGDYSFAKYGSVKVKYEELKFDITTLRKEEEYSDSRHPGKVIFVKDLQEDVVRRDFTINGLYMDRNLKVYDYVGGEKDLQNNIIKTIGNPEKRIQEDPLRIIRALRFALTYNFKIDVELEKAIFNNVDLLENLTKEKIIQDIKKIKNSTNEDISNLFNKFGIKKYVDMIK